MNLLEELAGVLGFEPRNAGIKTRCLTTWLHPNFPSDCFVNAISRLFSLNTWLFLIRSFVKYSSIETIALCLENFLSFDARAMLSHPCK
jgi:hypothetical protein